MSVYTSVSREQLVSFLRYYPLGELVDYQGITAGIENTNYFVTTTGGEFVLTLFEQLGQDELPYFLELTAYLAENDVPCPHPMPDRTGCYLRELNSKPAALVMRLCGEDAKSPTVGQCKALGAALGHMHLVSMDFPLFRANTRGPVWWNMTSGKVSPYLSGNDRRLLQTELLFQRSHRYEQLPLGVVHADLFRDNVLFNDDVLCGFIDFYYACNDVLLYDVAVTVNDWCSLPDGRLDPERLFPFLETYASQRAFTAQERSCWPLMLRAGALRFWLSRLKDWYFPRPGELTHRKDPQVFQRILEARRNISEELAFLPVL